MINKFESNRRQQKWIDDVHALAGAGYNWHTPAHWLLFVLAALSLSVLALPLLASGPMFDPAFDDPEREWCYAAQSTTVIGKPFVPASVQVTYDGAIYTGYAEMAFLYGKALRPVMARNKTFLQGWIPVVVYDWQD